MIPTSKDMRETKEDDLKVPGDVEKEKLEVEEKDIVHSQGNTRMVVHQLNKDNDNDDDDDLPLGPDFMQKLEDRERGDVPEDNQEDDEEDMSEQNIVDMATAVAVEMEEKRRNEEWEKQKEELKKQEEAKDQAEADALAREAERSELSIDELTTLRALEARLGLKKGQKPGPMTPISGQNQRQALDAYWEFVRENPQDFNGWVYLVQACETVDIIDEIRTVYNAFLPLFPYCYAYWQRYSDIEKRNENWSRALAILHRGLAAIPLSVELWVTYLDLYYKMYSNHEDFPSLYR